MKFSINKNTIFEELTNVSRAISAKNIIPILNGIKFELGKEGLLLTANDYNLTIRSLIPRDKIESIESEGIIIITSKILLDIIRKMPTNIINFEVIDDFKIAIYSGNSESDNYRNYSLNCLNSMDYPEIDFDDSKNHINIKSNKLKEMINQTIFAISDQPSRPLLTGLNIKINGNCLECVATDSYRLAKKNINLEETYDDSVNIVVPGNNINELSKILSDDDSNVEIHIYPKKIMFKFKNLAFQSNLLNGEYPNTSNFIPTEFTHIVTANLKNLYDTIDGAALLTLGKEKNIVKMDLSNNELIVSSYSSETGKAENKLTVKRNVTEPVSISYSAKYMLEALNSFNEEEVVLFMNTDSKPIVIKNIKDESLIQLILPIKTY